MAYEKKVIYHFNAGGEVWSVTSFSDTRISFEETRKNGQEDTHMSGSAELENGKWKITDGRGQIEFYEDAWVADDIEAYFNEHGPPKD